MKTMKCKEVRRLLPPYVDGELAGQAQASVHQHLASCPACNSAFEELKQNLALLRSAGTAEPGPYFAARVMADIRQAGRTSARTWLAWGRALGSAAAALLVMASIGVGALIGRGLAQGSPTGSVTSEELTVSSDEPAFADVFESALSGN